MSFNGENVANLLKNIEKTQQKRIYLTISLEDEYGNMKGLQTCYNGHGLLDSEDRTKFKNLNQAWNDIQPPLIISQMRVNSYNQLFKWYTQKKKFPAIGRNGKKYTISINGWKEKRT